MAPSGLAAAEKSSSQAAVRKKVGASRSGADFFLRSNKPCLCSMKTFILRESRLTSWEGRPIFPPFRPPRGALLSEAFEGWDGMRYPCAWLATLTPGHIQRAAAGQTDRGLTPAAVNAKAERCRVARQ